jgi:NitT/TauT family transport system permease protein
MSSARLLRLVLIAGAILGLEIACQAGSISSLVLIAPSEMLMQLWAMCRAGNVTGDLAFTAGNIALAITLSVIAGFAIGAAVHAMPRIRRALEPFLAAYYALPFFALYPVLIVLFGIGRPPIVAIGTLFAVVAMITATLNAFDRIPRSLLRTSRVYRMSVIGTLLKIQLPCAAPHLFTGLKLAVAYAFIGVIAAEFIMATSGLGYAIAYAFNNFDNRTMYALILLVLLLAIVINAVLHECEQRLLKQRGAR